MPLTEHHDDVSSALLMTSVHLFTFPASSLHSASPHNKLINDGDKSVLQIVQYEVQETNGLYSAVSATCVFQSSPAGVTRLITRRPSETEGKKIEK